MSNLKLESQTCTKFAGAFYFHQIQLFSTPAMGKAMSKFGRRSARNWNVENRAQREIDRQTKRIDRKIAPRHPETNEALHEMSKGEVGVEPKNLALDERLKKVRLDSYGPPPEIRTAQKNLPENRGIVKDLEFGYVEPTDIPKGRCSLRQALEFITSHQENPKEYTTRNIAEEYKMNEAQVQKVIKYFHMLNLRLPTDSSGQKLLDGERTASPIYKLLARDSKAKDSDEGSDKKS